jgi:hypothetical protein
MLAGGLHAGLSPEADPLNFVPRIKMPLLLSGRYDFGFPIGASQKLFVQPAGHAGRAEASRDLREYRPRASRTALMRELLA